MRRQTHLVIGAIAFIAYTYPLYLLLKFPSNVMLTAFFAVLFGSVMPDVLEPARTGLTAASATAASPEVLGDGIRHFRGAGFISILRSRIVPGLCCLGLLPRVPGASPRRCDNAGGVPR